MIRKSVFSIYIFIALLAYDAFGQKNDFGFWAGGSDYFGDLNTQTSFRFINPAAGIFYRHNFDERISARIGVSDGRVWADDAYSDNYYQYTRNLGFSSNILEGSAHLEFNFLPYATTPYASLNNKFNYKQRYSPYLLAGIGVFHFNPYVKYNGEKVLLQPLGTEGQGYVQYPELKRYKRTSTAIIFGGGFKFRVGPLTTFHIEAAVRKTSTDYLDDVSGVYADPVILLHEGGSKIAFLADPSVEILGEPIGTPGKMRGDSIKNDDYLFFGFGFSYTLRPYRCPYQK